MTDVLPYQPRNLDEVYALICENLSEHYEPTLVEQITKLWPSRAFVAVANGRVVGFIGGSVTSQGWSRVLLFAVDGRMRGLGIGTRLLGEFVKRALTDRDKGITLEIRMGNDKAMAFYAARGFHVAGRLPAFYTNGDDAIVLRRPFS